jgi:predicted nucleotidyltransferase
MTKQKILEILKEFKLENSSNLGIIELGVFGSIARDSFRDDSDIDIFVKTETANPYKIVEMKELLRAILNKDIDIIRLRESMNPFLKSRIDSEGIYV